MNQILDLLIEHGPLTMCQLSWECGVCEHLVRLWILELQLDGWCIEIEEASSVYRQAIVSLNL